MILAVIFGFDFSKSINNRVLDQLLNTSAIFSGFLLTLYGMLGSLRTLRVARLELFTSVKKYLKQYLIQAVVSNIGLHVTILIFYLVQNTHATLNTISQIIIFLFGMMSITTTFRFVSIFIHLAGGKEVDEE